MVIRDQKHRVSKPNIETVPPAQLSYVGERLALRQKKGATTRPSNPKHLRFCVLVRQKER